MALQDILDRIDKETQTRLQQLEQSFKKTVEKLKEENERKQKKIEEDMNAKVEMNSKKIMEKAENLATMENKNQLLKAKRDIIHQALEQAVTKLAESDEYVEILAALLEQIDADEGTVIPAEGKADQTKKAIEKSGKKFKVADKHGNFEGGFVFTTATMEINNSFENILFGQLIDHLEIELNKILFA